MKFEHTFVYQRDGKYVNAKLENHDIIEARKAMEAHKSANPLCTNYWVRAAHNTP